MKVFVFIFDIKNVGSFIIMNVMNIMIVLIINDNVINELL